MLTFAKIAAGAPSRQGAMAAHLLSQTVPREVADLARYYTTGQRADPAEGAAAVSDELTQARMRDDMHPLVARGLGVTAGQRLTRDQINAMLGGRRADGKLIDGKRQAGLRTITDKRTGKQKDLVPIGSFDFTLTPDKSVSVAWAFAAPAEQAAIYSAHRTAAHEAMLYLEARIGQVRLGDGGQDGVEPGHITWMSFDHYTSRPTLAVAKDENGQRTTEVVPVMVAGDPDLHTHHTVPNAVFCASGRVGSLDTTQTEGLIKEAGAYYQAHLATALRRLGADMALDPDTGMARMASIPTEIRDHFSKKTRNGEQAAREYAQAQGLDWDSLAPARRVGLLKAGTQGSVNAATDPETRGKLRKDDMADFTSWRTQADALGWRYQGLSGEPIALPDRQQRIELAYHTSQPWIERELNSRAVIDASDARTAALRGLIAHGIEGRHDIDAVTRLYRTDGVRQYGEQTSLAWGTEAVDGRQRTRITTALHVDHEREFVRLAQAGAADTSDALTPARLQQAVQATGIRLSPEQTTAAGRLAHGGKIGVVVGVAGSGKTTLLQPLVTAWQGQGRDVHGIALAWRQADDLTGAGIDKGRVKAFSVFAGATAKGEIRLTDRSVVVVDELSLLGTRQGLELLRLQSQHGFRLAMLGDDQQCQSIEAGPIIDLARKALGPDQVPEILTTARQQTEREREITGLFRAGKADAALAMKRADNTAELVPGGYREATERVAALVGERLRANGHDPSYTITASAPTNADAHKLGLAIRAERRGLGQLGADVVTIRAADGTGTTHDMPIAAGDRVRLFASTRADNSRRNIGRNGDVLTVLAADLHGMQVRNNKSGVEGRISWPALADGAGRLQLAYGDVMTTHTAQGSTATEHVYALPGGSSTVNGFSAYSSGTRHRRSAYLVLSEGAERAAVARSRPLNDPRPITLDDVWSSVGDHLSRMPRKEMASAMIKRVRDIRHGSMRRWHQHEVQREHGDRQGVSREPLQHRVERTRAQRVVEPVAQALRRGREVAVIVGERVREVVHARMHVDAQGRRHQRSQGPRMST